MVVVNGVIVNAYVHSNQHLYSHYWRTGRCEGQREVTYRQFLIPDQNAFSPFAFYRVFLHVECLVTSILSVSVGSTIIAAM